MMGRIKYEVGYKKKLENEMGKMKERINKKKKGYIK